MEKNIILQVSTIYYRKTPDYETFLTYVAGLLGMHYNIRMG